MLLRQPARCFGERRSVSRLGMGGLLLLVAALAVTFPLGALAKSSPSSALGLGGPAAPEGVLRPARAELMGVGRRVPVDHHSLRLRTVGPGPVRARRRLGRDSRCDREQVQRDDEHLGLDRSGSGSERSAGGRSA